MGFYEDLGVQPVINAATTLTALGGSRMPAEVIAAMNAAALSFVDMQELHIQAGRKLAQLTNNEAAYVTSGGAAALVLAILGIRTQGDPRAITAFPGHDSTRYEVIMHTAHRVPYDSAVGLSGSVVRQIGNVQQTFDWELDAAITDKTAAVLYVAGSHLPQVALSLEETVQIAHDRGIPVIVDAAAQLPPLENLWRFTRDIGADIAIFSGGKALHGPQASGLMVGHANLIEAARQNGSPFQRWARAMKVGKEEIAGLVAAVERFVGLDHEAAHNRWTAIVEEWNVAFSAIRGLVATIDSFNEAGQPIPRLHIVFDNAQFANGVLQQIEQSTPRVAVLPDRPNGRPIGFWLTPDLLETTEAETVQQVVAEAITHVMAK